MLSGDFQEYLMEILVSFDKIYGLTFKKREGKEFVDYHIVSVDTLKMMSLADLDYAISTNIITELSDIHIMFSEYLWSENGSVPPKLKPDDHRHSLK